ncbi:hypothetical protein LWI29_026214 [Acer saccharum]|uniref:GRF-type domain-containing protein n=1 Tax=Acer saccharum TaxID=4024 RepID=A0AA39SW85_ACESA|nr:hypothetical protein LWI29_026214 [Acer saccharum]
MASRRVRGPSSSQISAMNASVPDGDGEDMSSSGYRKCDCGLDAKLRTSTTVRNPGRRFYGCPNFVNGYVKGCGYFEWVDSSSFEVAREEVQWSCIVKDLVKALEKKEDDIRYLRYILGVAIIFCVIFGFGLGCCCCIKDKNY